LVVETSVSDMLTGRLISVETVTATGLTQPQIDSAFGASTTDLPAGLERPAHWPTTEDADQHDEDE
jgi:hypothetical protein